MFPVGPEYEAAISRGLLKALAEYLRKLSDPRPKGILSCYALLVMEGTRDSGLPAPAVTLNGRWTHSTQARNGPDRKSTRLNSSHITRSRMPSSA